MAEQAIFSKASLEEYSPDHCSIYILSDRQVALIISSLRYIFWDARWVNRDIDAELVMSIHEVLMSNCDEFTVQLRRIANALYANPDAGQVEANTDLGINDQDSIAQLVFSQTEAHEEEVTAYIEQIDQVEEALDAINVILGGSTVLGE